VEFIIVSKDVGLDNVVLQLSDIGRKAKRIVSNSIQSIVALIGSKITLPLSVVPVSYSDECLSAPCLLSSTAVNPLYNVSHEPPNIDYTITPEINKLTPTVSPAFLPTTDEEDLSDNFETKGQDSSFSDKDEINSLPGQLLPFDPKSALGVMTVRFYNKVGGVQQLKADVQATLEQVEDPADFALQIIINLRLKPFNKKRGHYRVFPKLLLRVLAIISPPITDKNRATAKEVLQVLENNTFGKKTVNKLKMIFKLDNVGWNEPSYTSVIPILNEPLKMPQIQTLQTGYNPLFSTQ